MKAGCALVAPLIDSGPFGVIAPLTLRETHGSEKNHYLPPLTRREQRVEHLEEPWAGETSHTRLNSKNNKISSDVKTFQNNSDVSSTTF